MSSHRTIWPCRSLSDSRPVLSTSPAIPSPRDLHSLVKSLFTPSLNSHRGSHGHGVSPRLLPSRSSAHARTPRPNAMRCAIRPIRHARRAAVAVALRRSSQMIGVCGPLQRQRSSPLQHRVKLASVQLLLYFPAPAQGLPSAR